MARHWMSLLVVLTVPLAVNGQQRGNAAAAPAAVPHNMSAPIRVAAPTAPASQAAAPKVSAPAAAGHSQMRPAVVNPHGTHAPAKVVGTKAPGKTRGNGPSTGMQGKAPNGPVYLPDVNSGYPVPGLGFDYVHYAAVHPNAYTDGQRHFRYGSSVPFLSGSWYVPMYYPDAAAPVAEAETEAPATDASESSEGEAVLNEPAAATAPAVKPAKAAMAPLAPSAEYTFVRRDGTVFFAVGYLWQGEKLQYVTQDGLRRSVPLADLDLDATSKFNEQRGVTFRSPA